MLPVLLCVCHGVSGSDKSANYWKKNQGREGHRMLDEVLQPIFSASTASNQHQKVWTVSSLAVLGSVSLADRIPFLLYFCMLLFFNVEFKSSVTSKLFRR